MKTIQKRFKDGHLEAYFARRVRGGEGVANRAEADGVLRLRCACTAPQARAHTLLRARGACTSTAYQRRRSPHSVRPRASRSLLKPRTPQVHHEVDIYSHMGGSLNVATLYEVFECESVVDLVMERCSGGELWKRIRKGSYSELGEGSRFGVQRVKGWDPSSYVQRACAAQGRALTMQRVCRGCAYGARDPAHRGAVPRAGRGDARHQGAPLGECRGLCLPRQRQR